MTLVDGLDPAGRLTHIDAHGKARMVDVTGKEPTRREAVARCVVRTGSPDASVLVAAGREAAEEARLAGAQAAKRTSVLVPLCHSIRLDGIEVRLEVANDEVRIEARAVVEERTGVEMEALTACAFAALVVVGTARADPLVRVDALTLWRKTGGRSGTWVRDEHGRVEHLLGAGDGPPLPSDVPS